MVITKGTLSKKLLSEGLSKLPSKGGQQGRQNEYHQDLYRPIVQMS